MRGATHRILRPIVDDQHRQVCQVVVGTLGVGVILVHHCPSVRVPEPASNQVRRQVML